MMETRHTPGEWRLGNDSGFWGQNCCIEADSEVGPVVICDFVHASAIEEEANKRLILKAPALLAALKELVADYEDYAYLPPNENYAKARAAIAQAEGVE